MLMIGVSVAEDVSDAAVDPWDEAIASRAKPQNHHLYSKELLYVVLVVTILEPYLTLKEYYQSSCTGTLIQKDLVLTAASCLHSDHEQYEAPDPASTMVYERTGRQLRAQKIYLHPEYLKAVHFDMALIVTPKSQQSGFPILPTAPFDFNRALGTCLVAGYGNQNKLALEHFQVSQLTFNRSDMEVIRCRETHKLCLHFENLLPCPGDVGSPLICNGEVRAFFTPNTRITYCQDSYGVAFTILYPARAWVLHIIREPVNSLEWMKSPLYIVLMCAGVTAVIVCIYCCLVQWLQRTINPGDDDEVSLGQQQQQQQQAQASAVVENQRDPFDENKRRKWTII